MLFVIEQDLGPVYWLRLPESDEDLSSLPTIELTAEEAADYREVESGLIRWRNRLEEQWKCQS